MNNGIYISSGRPAVKEIFNLAIGAIGYERRARHALRELQPIADVGIGLEFQDRQMYDFKQNKKAFEQSGFVSFPATTDSVRAVLTDWMPEGSRVNSYRVWVDISSMTRPLIATICYELWSRTAKAGAVVEASFVYSQAEFSPPAPDYGPIAYKGAVIPEFAGWADDPSIPCAAIFGIGYEVGLALGALEDLEPAEAWAFRPTGHVAAYDREIDKSNSDFLGELDPNHVLRYDVNSPLQLFSSLESVVYGSLSSRRVVIIPFGLKLFALGGCLVALQHFPRVNVWRVSGETLTKAVNRVPNGWISQVDVVFDRSRAELFRVPYHGLALA
jgi:hypothetical protein